MHTGLHLRVQKHLRLLLIGGAGGNNIGVCNGLVHAGCGMNPEPQRLQITAELLNSCGINIVHRKVLNAEDGAHPKGLELGLRTRADHRHLPRILARQVLSHHGRNSGGTKGGQQGHLCKEDRVTVIHISQHTECGHGLVPACRVRGVPIHVLKGIGDVI